MVDRTYKMNVAEIKPLRTGLGARIEAFAKLYNLSMAGFGRLILTPDQAVRLWVKGRTQPPASAVALMYVLENSAEARELLGVNRLKRRRRAPGTAPKKPKIRDEMRSRERRMNNIKDKRYYLEDFVEGPMDMWVTRMRDEG